MIDRLSRVAALVAVAGVSATYLLLSSTSTADEGGSGGDALTAKSATGLNGNIMSTNISESNSNSQPLTPSEMLSKEIQLDASSDIQGLRGKFLQFASVIEEGESLMTFDDFAKAHLGSQCNTPSRRYCLCHLPLPHDPFCEQTKRRRRRTLTAFEACSPSLT